jgi:hypothetical protein
MRGKNENFRLSTHVRLLPLTLDSKLGLDLIRHNIGTKLKLNKYIFDISIPFCHHLHLSATLKQYFTEFALATVTTVF